MDNDQIKKDESVVSNKNSRVTIAGEDTLEKFDFKIKQIDLKDKEKEAQVQAAILGVQYMNLNGFPISQDALEIVRKEDVTKNKIVCFFYGEKVLRFGVLDPNDEDTKKYLEQLQDKYYSKKFDIYLISNNSLKVALKAYETLPTIKEVRGGVQITKEDLKKFEGIQDFKGVSDAIKRVNLTDVLSLLMSVALNMGASDVHVEAGKDEVVIRYRLDGILHKVGILPKERWDDFISRIKLISGLKINKKDEPQDGRFVISLGGDDDIDVRVSTLPTAYGESVAIRILMFSKAAVSLEELGLSEYNFKIIDRAIHMPNGMILNTGPTGSGKTSTLYAILSKLNTEETKIVTIEDPIEYHLSGINQSQTNEDSGYTFAKALRSFVRQDPDVIMVGEMRDFETVDTAIQSALTGHLVLSTIHTNSAAGSIPRLLSMGTKSFLLAPAINVLIGQRLVRKLCPYCKEKVVLTDEIKEKITKKFLMAADSVKSEINIADLDSETFFIGKGCEKCHGLGYKGRVAIFEIIEFDEDLRKQIIMNENISEDMFKEMAIAKGMVTMEQDGIIKAKNGITTLDEIFRVTK